MTLGPNTRSALLGQPLALSMQVVLDAADDPQALCLDANVFYAGKQLDKNQVVVTPERAANARDWLIHVSAATPVEGPVVTVDLHAGCAQKTMRRYVVLAVAQLRPAAPAMQNALAAAGTPTPPAPGLQARPPPDPGADKTQALEAELSQLRADLFRNQAALAESRMQLEKAESGSYDKGLVYGLLALLSIAIIVLLFVMNLRSIARATRSGGAAGQADSGPEGGPSTVMLPTGTGPGSDLDINESLFDGLRRASRQPAADSVPPLPYRDRPRFSVSVPFVPRTVKVPELSDLQQQVESFSARGQQAGAIALLRKHLIDNVKTSALVYLDLLDLYHQAGNKQDYEDLRDDFNRVFNTAIAPFDLYTQANAGGPVYAAVLSRIQSVWPTRQVVTVIEDALFREPGNASEVLALEEYRELLLLYAVVREIVDLEASGHGGIDDTLRSERAMRPPSSPRLGLDIDLSQFSDGGNKAGGVQTPARASSAGRDASTEGGRGGAAAAPLPRPSGSTRPTGLDSLVDFDDYDTGYRPDDFDAPPRA